MSARIVYYPLGTGAGAPVVVLDLPGEPWAAMAVCARHFGGGCAPATPAGGRDEPDGRADGRSGDDGCRR